MAQGFIVAERHIVKMHKYLHDFNKCLYEFVVDGFIDVYPLRQAHMSHRQQGEIESALTSTAQQLWPELKKAPELNVVSRVQGVLLGNRPTINQFANSVVEIDVCSNVSWILAAKL